MPEFPCQHARGEHKFTDLRVIHCGHPEAIAEFGPRPSAGICMVKCHHYQGPERTDEFVQLTVGVPPRRRAVIKSPPPKARWFHHWLVPFRTRAGNCGCKPGDADDRTPLYRWLGVQWYGWPWPLRWRVRWPVRMERVTAQQIKLRARPPLHVKAMPGCGCMQILKDGYTRILAWWRYTYDQW